MKIAIHQPHYFPWLGYLDKMSKVDQFILLDQVQLEKGSYMYRNRIVDATSEIKFLTVSADKHGFLEKPYSEILTKDQDTWKMKQAALLKNIYEDCTHFEEVWEQISAIFDKEHVFLCDIAIRSIEILCQMLQIKTPMVQQSQMYFDDSVKKNDLVLELCRSVGASCYLSGNGARKYTDEQSFADAGVQLRYQVFCQPQYPQLHNLEFIPGLSTLDMLFNCGVAETRRIFWENVNCTNEIGD